MTRAVRAAMRLTYVRHQGTETPSARNASWALLVCRRGFTLGGEFKCTRQYLKRSTWRGYRRIIAHAGCHNDGGLQGEVKRGTRVDFRFVFHARCSVIMDSLCDKEKFEGIRLEKPQRTCVVSHRKRRASNVFRNEWRAWEPCRVASLQSSCTSSTTLAAVRDSDEHITGYPFVSPSFIIGTCC